MAQPHFNSQHSEVMLDVSAFHSSSPSAPQPKHHPKAKVAQSPTIEASQSEARVEESVERVEDSYQESMPMQPPPQHVDDDEEDDLYSLSPKGRQSVDATVVKRKAQAQRKQASMPKAKTVDALLDAGATVPSSAQNVAASDTKSINDPHTFSTVHDVSTLNANPGPINVNTTTAAGRRAGDKDCRHHDRKSETDRPRRDGNKSGDKSDSVNVPNNSVDDYVQPANAPKAASKVTAEMDGHMDSDAAEMTEINQTALSNGNQNGNQNHGNSGVASLDAAPSTLNTKPGRSTQNQHTRPAKASVNDSKGRPQRQAKQIALGKLKAKHDREGSDDDEMSDDSQDDGWNTVVQSKQTNAATGRNQNANHLPTPVTEGSLPKKKAETNPTGKLKPVKQQQTKTTASTKARLNQKSTQGTVAPAERTGRSADAATQKKMADPSTGANFAQSRPDHQRTDATASNRNDRHEPEDIPPPRRPGALKRPGRSYSRGRRPQRDTPYEFPGISSNTKKKRRSISIVSKASTTRAGPTRQRMKSKSVKVRPDRVSDDQNLPSTSQQVSPKGRSQKPSVSRDKKHDSRPPPETQGGATEKQRGSHVLLTAPAGKPQNTTTGGRKVTTQEKPGSSQAQAIMIEQDSQSESSSSPSPQKPASTHSKTTVHEMSRPTHVGRPQTPAMIPSSPPGSGRGTVHTLAQDKPSIIAFSRQGPRNQGMSSAKRHQGSAAHSMVLSDCRSSKAGNPDDYEKTIGLATQLFPPSSQLSHRASIQVSHTAQPSSAAKDDGCVFKRLTKNGKNNAPATLPQPSTLITELDQEDQDNGFAVIDDFEGTTLVDDCEQPGSSPKQPLASQVAMPPPNVVKRGKKSFKTASASVDLPTKAATKAAAAKDTPRSAPVKKAMEVPNVWEATKSISVAEGPKLLTEDATRHFAPQKKISEALPTDNTSRRKLSGGQGTEQPSQKTRKRGLAELQEDSPRKRTRVSEEGLLAVPEAKPANAQKAAIVQAVQTKDFTNHLGGKRSRPSRRSTQASQGVDILGSPYPKDLEVPKQTTALEVFSQQAGLSPDQTERSDVAPTGRLDLQAISWMVPTPEAGLVAGNGKPVLAAPRERSKAVTRIASGTLAEQLLAVRSVHTSEENPFTSSRERESSAGQRPAANKFREALQQRGIDLSDRPPAARSEELGDGSFDNAEENLVEPADDLEKANQHTASSPGVSEASNGRSPDAAANVLEDVGDWRNSLKPHQTHLFDSLVIAAHKLVRHTVDHETADRTMIEDYRRRGEIIVDELQRAHAKEYQRYAQNVQGWKTQAADELASHGRKLKQHMREAEKARTERKKALLARNGFDDVLEELVAGLN